MAEDIRRLTALRRLLLSSDNRQFSRGKGLRFTRSRSTSCDWAVTRIPDQSKPTEQEIENWIWSQIREFNGLYTIVGDKSVLRLERATWFGQGLRSVMDSGLSFGSNSSLHSQEFTLEVDPHLEPVCLTRLRALIVVGLLSRLIPFSGGSLQSDGSIKLIATNRPFVNSYVPVLVSAVDSGPTKLTADEYRRHRTVEVEEMGEHHLETNLSPNNAEDLVQATITFDMLKSKISKSICLRLGEEHSTSVRTSCKGALFVQYNYVRVVTIINKYEALVQSGTYPPLPCIDNVDFNLLDQPEEWTLLFDFVLNWPHIVDQSVEQLTQGRPKLHVFTEFLSNASVLFAGYYRRCRILTEPRPHFIPVLHARLHLLMGLRQVFECGFHVLGLTPVTRM